MCDGENSFTNGVNYDKNELVDNLRVLLTEHSRGILLTALEDIYKTKFSKSLLSELIKLALPDVIGKFVSITLEDQKNGLFDNIIALKDQDDSNQIQDQLLQEITKSGIVSREFHYALNSSISDNDQTFLAFVSNIDTRNRCIYMQPECYMEYMEKLTEELDIYYSDPISEQLLVKDVAIGLAYVSKFERIYHRVYVKESLPSTYVIIYVDLGLTVEVEKTEVQFKHLLDYFATLPCMAIACHLVGIEFKLNNYQMPPEIYRQLNALCQRGPFYVEPYDQVNGVLNVKIFDADQNCLNDIVVKQGLAFEAAMPPRIGIQNGGDQRETQHLPSPVNSKHKSLPHSDTSNATPITPDLNSDYLLDDYDTAILTETVSPSPHQSVTARTPARNAYDDYVMKDSSQTRSSKQSKHSTTFVQGPASNSTIKSGTQSNGARSTNQKNSNSMSQRDSRHDETRKPFTVTITRDFRNGRIFNAALSSLARNKAINQRPVSRPVETITYQKRDEFADWMCSWLIQQSLWSSDIYRSALLKYIGRIYKQGAHMYRIFAQLKTELQKLDELDLLNKLIENTKQRHDAQMSFDKWKNDSRINRRLQDLRVIFEFHGNYTASNHPFNITPAGLQIIVDRQTIRSYFDLGCGDGTITAGIGAYLGLNKETIFGGDVFEGQTKDITFIKLKESQSTIALPDNHVDLITSFVTFHHVSQLKETLTELVRILRRGGYLILREHDCTSKHELSAKYLNFVHAIMMIGGVGEFANSSSNPINKNQHVSSDHENDTNVWTKQKSWIIEYTKSIHYRTCEEWQQELASVGFHLRATLYYGANGSDNPQKLFYAVYQLDKR